MKEPELPKCPYCDHPISWNSEREGWFCDSCKVGPFQIDKGEVQGIIIPSIAEKAKEGGEAGGEELTLREDEEEDFLEWCRMQGHEPEAVMSYSPGVKKSMLKNFRRWKAQKS